jgi:hypothetical protein
VSERGAIRDGAGGLRADRGPEERWLSVYEVGAMTLQSPETVRRWLAEGLIAGEERGRLGVRIRESEVERFLRDNFRVEGRNVADHALSSNVTDVLRPATAPNERQLAGAGWPFNRRAPDATAS